MPNITVDFENFKSKNIKLENPETAGEYVLQFENHEEIYPNLRWSSKQTGNNLVISFERVAEFPNSYTKSVAVVSKSAVDGLYEVAYTDYEYETWTKEWDETGDGVEYLTKAQLKESGLSAGKTTELYRKNDEPVKLSQIKGFPAWDVLEKYGTITLTDYFKYNTDNVLVDVGGGPTSIIHMFNLYELDYRGETKSQTIKGSFIDNEIHGGSAGDKIYGVAGVNEIYGNKGDDSLYSGEDADTFNFSTGDASGKKGDVIYNADSLDRIRFGDSNWNYENNWEYLAFSKEGNNLVINHSYWEGEDDYIYDKVTVDKFFTSTDPDIEDMLVNGMEIRDAEIGQSGKGKLVGTNHKDYINALGASQMTTGEGNDELTTSTGADTITFDGAGDKTVNFVKYTGKDTVITTTDWVNADFVFDVDAELSYAKKGKDFVISAANAESINPLTNKKIKASVDTVTVKDYFNEFADYYPSLTINGNAISTYGKVNITTADKINGSSVYVGTELDNNFTYNGKGLYVAYSGYHTSDTYNINFNKNSQAIIVDEQAYDNDEIVFSSGFDNLRLMFNVDVSENPDGVIDMEFFGNDLFMFDNSYMNKKSFNSITKAILAEKVAGVKGFLDIGGYFSESAIETFTDGMNDIDMASWIGKVQSEVAGWLNENGYDTAMEAMGDAVMNKNVDISGLIAAYDISCANYIEPLA